MNALKICLCFFIVLSFVSCSKGEFRNIVSFIDSYNELTDSDLSLSDFITDFGSKTDYTAIIDNCVMLNLTEGNDGNIHMCRVITDKSSGNISAETAEIFRQTLKLTLMAYCSFSSDEAENIIRALNLDSNETFMKQGELTLKKDNFYFVYFSDEIISEVKISNTYLLKTETTEKPVSRPYYGEDFVEKDDN